MMEIKSILKELLYYYQVNRQVGHTTALLEGARKTDSLVLVDTLRERLHLNLPSERLISLNSLVRLRGKRKPLIMDHYAFEIILGATLKKINELESEKDCLQNFIYDALAAYKVKKKRVPKQRRKE